MVVLFWSSLSLPHGKRHFLGFPIGEECARMCCCRWTQKRFISSEASSEKLIMKCASPIIGFMIQTWSALRYISFQQYVIISLEVNYLQVGAPWLVLSKTLVSCHCNKSSSSILAPVHSPVLDIHWRIFVDEQRWFLRQEFPNSSPNGFDSWSIPSILG